VQRRPALAKALEHVEDELGRLTTAIALGGDTVTLVAAVRDREARRAAIRGELEAIDQPQAGPMNPTQQMKRLAARLEDWTGLLRSKPAKARQLLRKLVAGRFTSTAELRKRSYKFTVTGTMSNLLSGIVDVPGLPIAVASPTGVVPEWSRRIPGEVPAVGGSGKAA
jgi:hypothetical protein